jgi:hypothetical protein
VLLEAAGSVWLCALCGQLFVAGVLLALMVGCWT